MKQRVALSFTLIVATLALGAPAGWSQGFDAQSFHPAPSQRFNHFSVASGLIPEHLQWEAGVAANYGHNVLVQRDSNGDVVHAPLRSIMSLNLLGSIGLTGDLDIGLDIPLHLVQSGDDPAAGTQFIGVDGGAGLGDIRLAPRYRFFSTAEGNAGGLHLAGQLGLALPTGNKDAFRGGGFQLEPRVIAEFAGSGASRVAVNLGYLMRSQSYFADADLEVDDAITWGIGFRLGVSDDFAFIGTARSGTHR